MSKHLPILREMFPGEVMLDVEQIAKLNRPGSTRGCYELNSLAMVQSGYDSAQTVPQRRQ